MRKITHCFAVYFETGLLNEFGRILNDFFYSLIFSYIFNSLRSARLPANLIQVRFESIWEW